MEIIMKKRLLIILAVAILLVGCGNQQETNTPSTDIPTTTEPTSTTTEEPTEPPHEHTYTESTTTEATCTEVGEKTFTCDCGDTYTEPIEATGHNYEAVADSEVSATCTNDGKEADTKCSICGDIISGAVIPALSHSYGDYVYNNNATYTADGTETATCSTCGDKTTRTKAGTKLEPNYVGYDEFGNGYTLDENGDKVFYVSNPYPIKQPVWVSDKEVYFYNIFGQPSLSAELGREIAAKNGIPWDERVQSEVVRLGYYNGQMILRVRVYMD